MSKLYIGIDPGKNGGIVAKIDGKIIESIVMPTKAKFYLTGEIYKLFTNLVDSYETEEVMICFEDIHSMFRSSATANFGMGFAAGFLEGLCSGMGLPFIKVQPKKWQEYCWQGIQPIKINTGEKTKQGNIKYKTDTKGTSLVAVQRLYPKADLCGRGRTRATKPHDGVVDALLICHYAEQNL